MLGVKGEDVCHDDDNVVVARFHPALRHISRLSNIK